MALTDLTPGTRVADRFVVRGVLGRGASTVVYEALEDGAATPLALKVLRDAFEEGGVAHKRLQREATMVGSLDHPSIVRLLDSGLLPSGQPWLALARLFGETLEERLRREGALRLRVLRPLLDDALAALSVAHASRVLHRDIKPANLFITPEAHRERLVLLDFGVGRMLDDSVRLTLDPQIVGTIAYLAPELVTPGGEGDERADLYALGVVAFQALTGTLPYRARGIRLLRGIRDEPVLRASALDPSLSRDVDAFFDRALAKSRDERCQTAADMAECARRHLR